MIGIGGEYREFHNGEDSLLNGVDRMPRMLRLGYGFCVDYWRLAARGDKKSVRKEGLAGHGVCIIFSGRY